MAVYLSGDFFKVNYFYLIVFCRVLFIFDIRTIGRSSRGSLVYDQQLCCSG